MEIDFLPFFLRFSSFFRATGEFFAFFFFLFPGGGGRVPLCQAPPYNGLLYIQILYPSQSISRTRRAYRKKADLNSSRKVDLISTEVNNIRPYLFHFTSFFFPSDEISKLFKIFCQIWIFLWFYLNFLKLFFYRVAFFPIATEIILISHMSEIR